MLGETCFSKACYKYRTAVCHQVIQVKSFAPCIDHVVADVFVGPIDTTKQLFLDGIEYDTDTIRVLIAKMSSGAARCLKNDTFDFVSSSEDDVVMSPSCALSPDGVLHQEWMMPIR